MEMVLPLTINFFLSFKDGRIEQRKVCLTTEIQWLIERDPRWKNIKGIAIVDSTREARRKVSHEQRFYMTSHEDHNHLRSDYAPENFSMIKGLTVGFISA
ncbi:MAG: hypothetical protein V5789_10125 [Colwellia sp.]